MRNVKYSKPGLSKCNSETFLTRSPTPVFNVIFLELTFTRIKLLPKHPEHCSPNPALPSLGALLTDPLSWNGLHSKLSVVGSFNHCLPPEPFPTNSQNPAAPLPCSPDILLINPQENRPHSILYNSP